MPAGLGNLTEIICPKVWDTSNRAINMVINNLKGIIFNDDDFEHMSSSIEAGWGKIGMTDDKAL